MLVTMKNHHLNAVTACLAGREDTRHFLKYLCIDTREPEEARLVGTNGHILVACPVKVTDITPDDTPVTLLERIPPKLAPNRAKPYDITIDTLRFTAIHKHHKFEDKPCDFPVKIQQRDNKGYPEWRQIVGRLIHSNRKATSQICYDPVLIAPVCTVLNRYEHTVPLMIFRGKDDGIECYWNQHPEIVCILMPCRAWATEGWWKDVCPDLEMKP